MGMVVQHNMTAMNSNRMLGVTTSQQAKSTEKLSSGFKINRAADDAAGLSISEKMRKQIKGLTQASDNAQDGISAVQTAEGALGEVHDMLQRMNQLAVKAANGTNSESDRAAIQSEVDQLVTEIDRVSTTTKFNETYLLKGTDTEGKVGNLNYSASITGLKTKAGGAASGIDARTGIGYAAFSSGFANSVTVAKASQIETKFAAARDNTTASVVSVTVGGVNYNYIKSTKATNAGSFISATKLASELTKVYEDTKSNGKVTNQFFTSMDSLLSAVRHDNAADAKNVTSTFASGVTGTKLAVKFEAFADLNNATDLSLHVGADSSDDNKISMNIAQMSARGLGINGLDLSGKTADKATAAIDTIADALQKVSDQRASLGAIQNRLEHTIKNLDNVVENTTSAESAIRDTDMASEMVTFSKNNILAQAGQSMLAQANQSNQGVLSLLG